MRNSNISKKGLKILFSLFVILFTSCSNDEASLPYEDVRVVGVKVGGSLYNPTYDGNTATVVLPVGLDLSKVKLQVLVANGDLLDFANDTYHDCRRPFDLKLSSFNGGIIDCKLRIQSPPKLTNLVIEGMSIPSKDIYFSTNSVTVQVPKNTDLTALKVTMSFINGKVKDFTNGVAFDYTNSKPFSILGVDEETVYHYNLIVTTEPVGPAFVKSITVNGVKSDSVVQTGNNLTIYIPYLIELSNNDIVLECGINNKINPASKLTGLNLFKGNNTVKITGTNNIETEFTILTPKLSLSPVMSKNYADFGFGADALTSIAFSGNYFVTTNHNSANVNLVPVGPNYYTFSGERVNMLSRDGSNIDGGTALGIRKVTADEKGVILGVQLGATAASEFAIYRWDDVTAKPIKYISYSQASLGLSYLPRAAGINVTGSLDGDAIIVVPMAKKQDVMVWKVTAGILNSQPLKFTFPFTDTPFYYSVQPMPVGMEGFVGATSATADDQKGIVSLTSTMTVSLKLSGFVTSDCKVLKYKNHVYLAYTVFAPGKGAYMRVCDITDGSGFSYQNPIMDILLVSNQGNANNTMDAELFVKDNKLHAAFVCSNMGMRIYCLEK